MTKVVGVVPQELRALVQDANRARSDLDVTHAKVHAVQDELRSAYSNVRYRVNLLFSELAKQMPVVEHGRDGRFQIDPDTFEVSYLPECGPDEDEDLH